eukprot:6178533-Pleurochrysis_carterae.AAC.2
MPNYAMLRESVRERERSRGRDEESKRERDSNNKSERLRECCAHLCKLVDARAGRQQMLTMRFPAAGDAVCNEALFVEDAVPLYLDLVGKLSRQQSSSEVVCANKSTLADH